MKVSELSDEKLDYWVAKAAGHLLEPHHMFNHWLGVRTNDGAQFGLGLIIFDDEEREQFSGENELYSPSAAWSQGGPIIEREKIESHFNPYAKTWIARYFDDNRFTGESLLIAAMRCFVASKFGEEVPSE